jgi:hypothetical protein
LVLRLVGPATVLLCGVVAATATAATPTRLPASARGTACARAAGPSGDQRLVEADIQGPLTAAIASGSEKDAEQAAANLAAVRPCSPAGVAAQQDMLAFLGWQLAAKECHKIVENSPTMAAVSAYLTCIAPVNYAAVQLERELAQLESKMFQAGKSCSGQGVGALTAAKAIAAVKSRVDQAKQVAGGLEAVTSLTSEAMGVADESEFTEGFNEFSTTIEVFGAAQEKAADAVAEARTTSGALHAGALSGSTQLWLALMKRASGYAAKFATNVTALKRDLAARKEGPARAAAALAQLHADQLAAVLGSAVQAQGHLPSELQTSTGLAAVVPPSLIAKLKQQISAGTLRVNGRRIDPALLAGARSIKLDSFAGRTALSLLDSPELVRAEKQLVKQLPSLGLLAALDGPRSP